MMELGDRKTWGACAVLVMGWGSLQSQQQTMTTQLATYQKDITTLTSAQALLTAQGSSQEAAVAALVKDIADQGVEMRRSLESMRQRQQDLHDRLGVFERLEDQRRTRAKNNAGVWEGTMKKWGKEEAKKTRLYEAQLAADARVLAGLRETTQRDTKRIDAMAESLRRMERAFCRMQGTCQE